MMICKRCGSVLRENATVCEQCGAAVASREAAPGGLRQGKAYTPRAGRAGSAAPSAPLRGAEEGEKRYAAAARGDSAKPLARPGAASSATGEKRHGRQASRRQPRRMMVNWAMLGAVALVLVVFALIGGYVFLKMTDAGQLILARMGREADATALWTYGQELLDQGHVSRSIETYEKALAQEPEREDLYDRLIQLADAYEAAGRTGDAEKVYVRMYTEVDKENTYAYREVMRIMENQDRKMELSSFLQTAYENTQDSFFRRQREALIPSTPTASEEAGGRKMEQDVELLSAEDYDIYFIFGEEGSLPEDGTLYTEPLHLTEGSYLIRAVAVSSDLISDELKIEYTIRLPSPLAPGISLSPGVYERRQRVWLRHIESEDEHLLGDRYPKLRDITIYYTVDGQTPTSNSPIFDGEPFYLPAGDSVLKAVAVNGYGKVSNILERTYKIKNVRFEKYFNENDSFPDFEIMKTGRDAFEKKFGSPRAEEEIEDLSVTGRTVRLDYSWGWAKFAMTDSGYVLYSLESASASLSGPRKTRMGMSEKDIVDKFRDMGQAHDQNGDRSIYFDKKVGYAKKYHLDSEHDRIDYAYFRQDNGTVVLSYYLKDGKVEKMAVRCGY